MHALARDVDDDAAGGAVVVLVGGRGLAVLGDRGRVLQGEAHDVDVASAGAVRGEGDGGVGLGVGASSAARRFSASTMRPRSVPAAAAFASSMPT